MSGHTVVETCAPQAAAESGEQHAERTLAQPLAHEGLCWLQRVPACRNMRSLAGMPTVLPAQGKGTRQEQQVEDEQRLSLGPAHPRAKKTLLLPGCCMLAIKQV